MKKAAETICKDIRNLVGDEVINEILGKVFGEECEKIIAEKIKRLF